SYWMCDYGRYRYEWMNRGNRIEAPLVRDAANKLVATGWQQVMTALVEKAKAKATARVVCSPFHSVEDAAFAARLGSQFGSAELVYRSERAQDEVVCPGFPKLARRRDLAANTHGLEKIGFRRVGNDDGAGGIEGKTDILIV